MPVDIASGVVTLEHQDSFVAGNVPLIWQRYYSTALSRHTCTAGFGPGWTTRFHCTLRKLDGGYLFVSPHGAEEIFPDRGDDVSRGAVVRNFSAYLEVFKQGERYIVQSWDVDTAEVWRYCFIPGETGQEWLLSSIEDVCGQGLDMKWESVAGGHRLTEIIQRLERRRLKLAYNRAGLVEEVRLNGSNGEEHRVAAYQYDTLGRLIDARDAADFSDRFEYDESGRLTREVVKDGGVFHYRYDHKQRCVLRTGLGHYNERRLRFLEDARLTELTDSYGQVSVHHYLPSGQMTLETDPLGGCRSTEYDEHARIVARADATGATVRYRYDELGNRNELIDALGNSTKFTFNVHHQPLTMTDGAGQIWHRQYDGRNRLISSTDPLGHRWECAYDAAGNLSELTNPRGDQRHFDFDNGLLQRATDWMGHESNFRFDSFGRIVERKGPLGDVTTIRFDILGRPVHAALPDGSSLIASYDHASNLTHFVDALGNVTRWRYGPCSRLLERTDAIGGTVLFRWGTERERLTAVVNENGETCEFDHDVCGRVIRQRGFDGATRQFYYDAEGYLVGLLNPSDEMIVVERNAEHQVVRQYLPDGQGANFFYDPLGRLAQAINSDVGIRFERDAVGRVVVEHQGEDWVRNSYDAMGFCVRTETSRGHVAAFDIDPNGNVSALRTADQETAFERDEYGRQIACRLPKGACLEQQFDILGRLVEQRLRVSATSAGGLSGRDSVRRSFRYNGNGALTSITDDSWGHMELEYDPAERLISVLRSRGSSERFEYDNRSNLVRQARDSSELSDQLLEYGPGNRLQRKGDTRYVYDKAGRRTQSTASTGGGDRTTRYKWDALDRLRSVINPDGEEWRYQYDAFSRRIAKVGVGETTYFIWNGETLIHEITIKEELATDRVTSWVFKHNSFVPLMKVEGERCYFVVADHLGTPCELVDSGGHMVWAMTALAYGRVEDVAGSQKTDCPLRFQGQYEDAETGLHYSWNRYFDPDTGAFISQDPIGLVGGFNAYSYGANPSQCIDPRGLTTEYPVLAQATHVNSYGDEMVAMSKPSTKESLFQQHTYVNPGHHDPSSLSYLSNKSVLPPNHVELFQRSQVVEMKSGKNIRWAREGSGKDAVYHRFDQHADGEFHWNGSTRGKTKGGQDRSINANLVPKCVRG